MTRKKTQALLFTSFGLVLAAGFALGAVITARKPPDEPRSWLADELHLNARQKEQLHDIWSETMGQLHTAHNRKRRELLEARERAVLDMLSPDQQERYRLIQEEYESRRADLGAERQQAFDQAVARTKEILTPEQRAAYEKILARMREGGRRGRRGGPSHGERPGTPPEVDGPPGPPPNVDSSVGPPPDVGGSVGLPPELDHRRCAARGRGHNRSAPHEADRDAGADAGPNPPAP